MTQHRPQLRLVDDPVANVLWLLNRLPIEVAASYLALLYAYAVEREMLSEDAQARISTLLEQILSDKIHRAA
jgi:hypothetical protein